MKRNKFTEAKTVAEFVTWVRDNKHFEGWWNGDPKKPESFSLRGDRAQIQIAADLHDPDVIEPDDFDTTGRMFRPSRKGYSIIGAQ